MCVSIVWSLLNSILDLYLTSGSFNPDSPPWKGIYAIINPLSRSVVLWPSQPFHASAWVIARKAIQSRVSAALHPQYWCSHWGWDTIRDHFIWRICHIFLLRIKLAFSFISNFWQCTCSNYLQSSLKPQYRIYLTTKELKTSRLLHEKRNEKGSKPVRCPSY